jgi:hypothetical protein
MNQGWAAGLETLSARNQNLLKPIVREACNIHQDINLLSCNLTKLCLPLGALFVGVSDRIHDHVGVKACAITIDFVGELVVYEKESHEITGYSNTI